MRSGESNTNNYTMKNYRISQIKNKKKTEYGFTIFELLVAVSIVAILMGIVIFDIRGLQRKSVDAGDLVKGFVKQVRTRAVSSTLAYKVLPSSTTQIIAQFATTCSAGSWSNDPLLILNIPDDVELTDTSWEVCFNSRGIANSNITIPLQDEEGETTTVEIMLGGSTRIL